MDPAYYLWLKPSTEACHLLAGTIRDLAQQLDAPVFEPHITILGELQGTEAQHRLRCEFLAQRLPAVPIRLGPADHEPDYFRCVFLPVDLTDAIVDARERANRLFEKPSALYSPHVSLLYGLYPESRRIDIAEGVSPKLSAPFEATAVSLIRADSRDPRDWHELGSFPLLT